MPDTCLHPVTPRRQAALDFLREITPKLSEGAYADELWGLGPYLSCGLLQYEEVVKAAAEQHQPGALKTLWESLSKRTWERGWLEARPQVWTAWRRVVAESRKQTEQEGYQRALAGQTGLGVFDRWSRTVRELGRLSLRERRAFASLWIFKLGLPWALGAEFFQRFLLDRSPATNLHLWRSVAGLQGGKPYLVSASELIRLAEETEQGDLELPTQARPAPGFATPPPGRHAPLPQTPSDKLGEAYALLLTPGDLTPEQSKIAGLKPGLILCLEGEVSDDPGSRFEREATDDGLDRCRAHYGVEIGRLRTEHDPPAELARLLQGFGLSNLVYFQPDVGEWRDALTALQTRDEGVRFFPLLRPWDAALLPLAERSFVPFHKQAQAKILRFR